jgi:ankyrin repeat protein
MATEQGRSNQSQFEKLLGQHIGNAAFIKAQTHLAPSTGNIRQAAVYATNSLYNAVNRQDVDEVRYLLQVPNINVNVQTIDGMTPLTLALSNHGSAVGPKKARLQEILDILLEAPGLNPNVHISTYPPLIITIKNRDTDGFKKLMNHFAIDINTKSLYGEWSGTNALMYVIGNYDNSPQMKEFFDMILEKGPDINAVDIYGQTALILAIVKNKGDLIDKLLDVDGINLNLRDPYGDNAITYAARIWGNNSRPIIRKLLEKGAQVGPDDPPIVQEIYRKYQHEILDKMKLSRRNPLNPNVMGEIKKFIGGKTRRYKRITRKTRRLLRDNVPKKRFALGSHLRTESRRRR